jgi:hypothetical protein
MPTTVRSDIDIETIQRLSISLNDCFSTLDAAPGVFSDDAFFDLLPPLWRFQLQGPDALVAQLRAIAQGETSARILRVVPTTTGFVMEHEETQQLPDGTVEIARRIFLCEVQDDRITEVSCYCNGGWDDELRARHAAEAPMLRP